MSRTSSHVDSHLVDRAAGPGRRDGLAGTRREPAGTLEREPQDGRRAGAAEDLDLLVQALRDTLEQGDGALRVERREHGRGLDPLAALQLDGLDGSVETALDGDGAGAGAQLGAGKEPLVSALPESRGAAAAHGLRAPRDRIGL